MLFIRLLSSSEQCLPTIAAPLNTTILTIQATILSIGANSFVLNSQAGNLIRNSAYELHELIPPKLKTMFSIISGALKLLSQIYSAQKQASYRNDVLQGIQIIVDMLVAIKKELDHIKAMTEWTTLIGEIKGADGTINNLYHYEDVQAWLQWDGKGESPKLSDKTLKEISKADIDNCLHLIDGAIMGSVSSMPPWLQIFIEKTGDDSPNTSRAEAAFAFFAGYLISVQLRGLTLLVAAGDKDAESIKKRLEGKFGSQGHSCQTLVDKLLGGDDFWTADEDHGTEVYNYEEINYDGIPSAFLVEGHAICGIRWVEDGEGRLTLKLMHGKVNKHGYIDKIETGYSGGKPYLMNKGHNKDVNNFGFFNTNSIEIPEGHVITNIGLNVYQSYTTTSGSGWAVQINNHMAMTFVVRHAAINSDGTIDTKNVGVISSTGDFKGDDDGIPPSNFQKWRSFKGENIQTTPMTGLKVSAGDYFCPSTKDSIHRKSFGPPK